MKKGLQNSWIFIAQRQEVDLVFASGPASFLVLVLLVRTLKIDVT